MYITGSQSDFASRLHELGYDPVALPTFISEGNQYIRKQTPQISGKWENEARRCQTSFTGTNGMLTQQFGIGIPTGILWSAYVFNFTGSSFATLTPIATPTGSFAFSGVAGQTFVVAASMTPGVHYQLTITVTDNISSSMEIATYDDGIDLINELYTVPGAFTSGTFTFDFIAGQPVVGNLKLIIDATPLSNTNYIATINSAYIMPP